MLDWLLSDFRWYRRFKGGVWSHITVPAIGNPSGWTQSVPKPYERVIEREFYVYYGEAGKISDGYHTFDELYEHRYYLYLAFLHYHSDHWGAWKARKHHDGTGWDGWFLVGTNVDGRQISYHLPSRLWDEAWWLTEYDRAPVEFDGHSSRDVIDRLARWIKR
jgi:hypothetical protein